MKQYWAWFSGVVCAGVIVAGCSGSSSSNRGAAAAAATTSGTPATTTTSSTAPGTSGSTAPATSTVTSAPPAPATPRQPAPGAWYKGDLHSHSATHSDDARRQMGDDIATTVRVAERAGLDFLAGTDHRTNAVIADPNFSSQTMVLLRGMEWGGSMHAGAIGLTAPIQVNTTTSGAALGPEIDGIVANIHSQGGIFVLNHPFHEGKLWVVEPLAFDAIEVWNSQWSMMESSPRTQQDLDDKMASEGLTAAGIAAHPHIAAGIADQRGSTSLQALTMYESYLNSGRRIAAVGGGDRHMLFRQGSPTTHVYAATRDRQGILDGIRQCRTYVSRTVAGPLVSFRADDDRDGIFESLLGDEVTPGAPADFRVVVEGAQGGRLDVIKRGQVIHSVPILNQTFTFTFSETPARGDWYRVDVFEPIDPQVQQSLGLVMRAAQASGQSWAPFAALIGFLPRSALDGTHGTLLPTVILPDQVDRVLNESLKDPGYCRGAITSPIFVKR